MPSRPSASTSETWGWCSKEGPHPPQFGQPCWPARCSNAGHGHNVPLKPQRPPEAKKFQPSETDGVAWEAEAPLEVSSAARCRRPIWRRFGGLPGACHLSQRRKKSLEPKWIPMQESRMMMMMMMMMRMMMMMMMMMTTTIITMTMTMAVRRGFSFFQSEPATRAASAALCSNTGRLFLNRSLASKLHGHVNFNWNFNKIYMAVIEISINLIEISINFIEISIDAM